MKKVWGILAGLGLAAGLFAGAEQASFINKFGGLNTDDDPLLLQDNETPASYNVMTDGASGLGPRQGFIIYSTEPSKASWVFAKSDGTRYLITHSGNNLKADAGPKTFTTLVSTVAAGITTAGAQLGDYFYFCNTVDGLKRWNGTTTSVADATITADKLVTWKGRLAAAGKTGAERTIFLSKLYDGASWTLVTNPSDDDPSQITVGGALDENISGLYASFKDVLVWFKNNSFGGLYGSRRSNFALRTFSESVGSNHPDTVKDCDGFLRFLGPRRTVWEFDGSSLKKISENNDTLLAGIVNGETNTRSQSYTSETDFSAGTLTGVSATVSPGDVVLSTWTATDTSSGDFGNGTLTNVSTAIVSGSLYLVKTSSEIQNNGFEYGSGSDADDWTEDIAGHSYRNGGETARSGSYGVIARTDYYASGGQYCGVDETGDQSVIIYRADGTALANVTYTLTTSWAQKTIDLSAYDGQSIIISMPVRKAIGLGPGTCGPIGTFVALTSDPFLSRGGNLTFYAKVPSGATTFVYFDDFSASVSTVTSGSFVSQTFDTQLSTPSWRVGSAGFTANTNSLNFFTASSSDGSSWDSNVAWSTASAPTSAKKRYVRYQINVSTTSSGIGWPYVSDVTLSGRQSTGSWVGPSIQTGPNISSWNVFQSVESLDGGALSYAIYTDTDAAKTVASGVPAAGTWISSQAITSASIPTIATNTYAFLAANFSITAATQNPTNSSLVQSWNEGSGVKAKGAWTNQRYWLSVGVGAATNNRIFVYDRKQEWQDWRGISADAMILHNSDMLFGNTSGIWQAEQGTTDNGTAITASYATKTILPSGPDLRSYFRDVVMTTKRSDATIATEYFLEGEPTGISLGDYTMNVKPGYQNFRLPVSFDAAQQGRALSLRWTVTGSDSWSILNASVYFDQDKTRDAAPEYEFME